MCISLPGKMKRMKPAVEYAELNGFSVGLTSGNHLVFEGYGRKVFGAGTPRSEKSAKMAITKMRNVKNGVPIDA